MIVPIGGRVEGRVVQLDKGCDVADGQRVEGWTCQTPVALPTPGQITADEARRLLGHAVVVACTRRGIDIRELDWAVPDDEPFDSMTWYRVVHNLDDVNPWPTWLPLFAHLLQLVERAPDEVWSHMRDVQVVTTGLLERHGENSAVASNARLITLVVLRVVEFCSEGTHIGPLHLFEIQSEANTILQACAEAEDRLA